MSYRSEQLGLHLVSYYVVTIAAFVTYMFSHWKPILTLPDLGIHGVLVNNYIVRSYRDVIVVANIVTRTASKT